MYFEKSLEGIGVIVRDFNRWILSSILSVEEKSTTGILSEVLGVKSLFFENLALLFCFYISFFFENFENLLNLISYFRIYFKKKYYF